MKESSKNGTANTPVLASPSLTILKETFARPWDSQLPLHAKVYRGLRYAIENYFQDGQRFYTEQELIEFLKVSQVTVRRAVYDLVGDGLLERRVAKGSFVRRPKPGAGAALEIGIHLVDWDSSFLSHVLREVLGVCQSRQLGAKVFYSRQSGDILGRGGEVWSQNNISAGILVATPPQLAAELSQNYLAMGKPVVAVDSRAPDDRVHFVGTDSLAITRIGLDHLTALGHRRICFLVNEPEASENVRLRIKFFAQESKERGLEARIVRCGTQFWESSYSKAYSTMPEVMELKPTAIFAFDDSGAWAALKWCLNHGIQVPQDLSILGFANDRPSAFTHPALSTIAHPIRELATTAVDLVTSATESPQVKMFAPKLMVRESTGPVPK